MNTRKESQKEKRENSYLGPDLRHDAWILTAFRGKEGSPLSRQFGYRENGGVRMRGRGDPGLNSYILLSKRDVNDELL